MSSFENYLGSIEYMRIGRQIQRLHHDPRFTEEEKLTIKKYLTCEQEKAEQMMNNKGSKPMFSS